MITQQLVRRNPRERALIGLTVLAVVGAALYLAAVAPAQDTLAEQKGELDSRQANLSLQKQQMTLLRTETAACRRTLEQLAGASEPWLRKDEADALLQQWQRLGAQLSVTVKAVGRDRQAALAVPGSPKEIEVLVLRLEMQGSYAGLMAMFARLTEGETAVGLERLDIKVSDQPPYDLEATLLVRVPVDPEGKPDA